MTPFQPGTWRLSGQPSRWIPSEAVLAVCAFGLVVAFAPQAARAAPKSAAATPTPASGSASTMRLVTTCSVTVKSSDTPDSLVALYRAGSWTTLQEKLSALAKSIQGDETCSDPVFKTQDRISFVLVDAVTPGLVRLPGGRQKTDISSTRLIPPSKGSPVYSVYVSVEKDKGPTVSSVFSATQTPSPLQQSFSQAFSAAVGVVGKLPVQAAAAVKAIVAKSFSLKCVVRAAILPDGSDWAQVGVTDTVDLSALLTADAVHEGVSQSLPPGGDTDVPVVLEDNTTEASFISASSKRIRKLNDDDKESLKSDAACKKTGAGPYAADTQSACAKVLGTNLARFRDDLDKMLAKWVPTTTNAENPDEVKRVRAIRTDYLTYSDTGAAIDVRYAAILTTTASATLQTSYLYGERTAWTFGLGAGVITNATWNEPVKLSSGLLVADPSNNVLTSVNVNWFPSSFDETSLQPSGKELFRVVGGVVLTPNPGVFGGVGLGMGWLGSLVRGFSINAGYTVMLATVPADNAHVGDKAGTKRGGVGAWLLELGYGF